MKNHRNIQLAAYIISIFGLVSEMPFLRVQFSQEGLFTMILRSILSSVYLFDFTDFLYYIRISNNLGINIPHCIFYSLMLLGAVLYSRSRFTETRLLRFSFSIILLNKVIGILNSAIHLFYPIRITIVSGYEFWIFQFFVIAKMLFLAHISYQFLKETNKKTELATESYEYANETIVNYVVASKSQRLLHLILDLIFTFLLFYFLVLMYREPFSKLSVVFGSATEAFIFIFFRLLYYTFYEGLLGSSPAKYLTETRVIDENGNQVGFGTAFKRTILRFVPFEPLSFFGYGWHDRWSNTYVVKETTKGISGKKYFLILPTLIFLVGGFYLGMDYYRDYQYKLVNISNFNDQVAELELKLKTISVGDFIGIKQIRKENVYQAPAPETESSDAAISKEAEIVATDISAEEVDNIYNTNFLRVDAIEKDSLLVSMMYYDFNDYGPYTGILDTYFKNKDNLSKKKIKKSSLFDGITRDYDKSIEGKSSNVAVFGTERKFEVNNVVPLYAPSLSNSGSSFTSEYMSISIKNRAWGGKITKIIPIVGSLTLSESLPITIEEAKQFETSFYLSFTGKLSDNYKFQFLVKSDLEQEYTYEIEGERTVWKIKRVK